MIDTKILKSLETNFQDPSYSVCISKFEQSELCNKDILKIVLNQFSPNLETIIESHENTIEILKNLLEENNIEVPTLSTYTINNCIEKTITIESVLDTNKKDGLFISRLNGTIENDIEKNITSRYLEGNIENQKINLTLKDVPNYFSRNKFKINGNQLVVKIPKKIEGFNLNLTQNDTTTTYDQSNVENHILYIDIDPSLNYDFNLRYTIKDSPILLNMESIVCQLASKIDIEFSNKYEKIPAIIPTIDEDNKIYTSYTTTFKTDSNNNYTGVTITFKGLKRKKEYGDINITIIGTKTEEYNDAINGN